MTKHYSQKDNLISIMKEISKKTPRGILNGDTQVGHITWQMYLMRDYLKLDGTPLANASNDYSDLLSFAQDNNLITADTTDNSLFKYDSTTDVLTLPNYIDLVLQGGNNVEEKEAGLPNIKGTGINGTGYGGYNIPLGSGALSGTTTEYVQSAISSDTVGSATRLISPTFDASRSSSIYSDSVNTVQPPAITLIPQIKYRKATTMYEQIDAVVNYSTTEKVIGTWIDGKPLYQKTILFDDSFSCEPNVRYEVLKDINDLNIDTYVECNTLFSHNGTIQNLPAGVYNADGVQIVQIYCYHVILNSINYLRFEYYRKVGTSAVSDIVVTLKYTKTTD